LGEVAHRGALAGCLSRQAAGADGGGSWVVGVAGAVVCERGVCGGCGRGRGSGACRGKQGQGAGAASGQLWEEAMAEGMGREGAKLPNYEVRAV